MEKNYIKDSKRIKILVWCYGKRGKEFSKIITNNKKYNCDVVGVTDQKQMIDIEYPFYVNDEVGTIDYDIIVVACDNSKSIDDIKEYILERDLAKEEDIYYWLDYLNEIRKVHLIEKYKDSYDASICDCIEYWKHNKLSTKNIWENHQKVRYELKYEEALDMPYIVIFGKKMYYPKRYWDGNTREKQFIENVVEKDQYEESPHLYTKQNHRVKEGDVIVDAGTCEGNFALRYIDIVSKVYLVEPDSQWMETLKKTFEPWEDKVVFCDKALGYEDHEKEITLDTLLENENKVDFLKMDIEGAEPLALLGGIEAISRLKPLCSICSYHKRNDERSIRMILESMGYKTSVSNGYMFFMWDPTIDTTLDLRRGVVYGQYIKAEDDL